MPRTGGTFTTEFICDSFKCYKTKKPHLGLCYIPFDIIKRKYLFGFIRNPFDWYVSWWSHSSIKYNSFDKFLNIMFDVELWPKEQFLKMTSYGLERYELMKKLDIGYCSMRFLEIFSFIQFVFSEHVLDRWEHKFDFIIRPEIFKVEDGINEHINYVFDLSEKQQNNLQNKPHVNISDHKWYMDYYNDKMTNEIIYKDRFIFNKFPEYLP